VLKVTTRESMVGGREQFSIFPLIKQAKIAEMRLIFFQFSL